MPICERDPWRFQFFEKVFCPQDIKIPTDDLDSYDWYPEQRWVYDKLQVAKSQGLVCGMAGDIPKAFPVFAKPNINLRGMGLQSGSVIDRASFDELPAGHMWMPVFTGEHVSTDCAIVRGKMCWVRHSLGLPWLQGMFRHWVIESGQRVELANYLSSWIDRNMTGYTGMMNFETIGGKIIECHLRFTDQWCDLYGGTWFDALVQLYAKGVWNHHRQPIGDGYSVPLFAQHGVLPPHPTADEQQNIRAMPRISSLQITYYESKPGQAHPMPPGGFRLGIVNSTDLKQGLAAREQLAKAFPGCDVMLP